MNPKKIKSPNSLKPAEKSWVHISKQWLMYLHHTSNIYDIQ